MAKTERDEMLDALAARMFSAMLDDILMDVAIQAHQDVSRSKATCETCGTRCRESHLPGQSTWSGKSSSGNSMSFSLAGSQGNTDKGGKDGTTYLPCVKCEREIASNRYAAHLGTCMAIGSPRKAAQRTVPSKAGSESGSPFPSENGDADDPRPPAPVPPKKGRPPKNKGKVSDDTNKKRLASSGPQTQSPKNKKQKTTSASPLARVASDGTILNGTASAGASTLSKVPSRLRESSTLFERDSSASRSPSPALAASLPAAPSTALNGFGKSRAAPAQNRGPSPLGPPPPVPVIHRPHTDYLIDVEGDETGSSTDTDTD